MSNQIKKRDTITITIQGPKKIRQEVVDRVFETVMEDDLLEKIKTPIAGLTFSSTLTPSDEVML